MVKKQKICRRLGTAVFEQCAGEKAARQTGKQQRRGKRPRPLSEYGQQMLEKQRARFTYGLRERQFSNAVHEAARNPSTKPAEYLYRILESRLDNVVYRLGLATTRAAARQIVAHGHIMVNGRKMDIPSYRVSPGDEVRVKDVSRDKGMFLGVAERLEEYTPPAWLKLDRTYMAGRVESAPTLDTYTDALFNLTAVLEFYSR